jgi:hypothetical protein
MHLLSFRCQELCQSSLADALMGSVIHDPVTKLPRLVRILHTYSASVVFMSTIKIVSCAKGHAQSKLVDGWCMCIMYEKIIQHQVF